MAVPPQEWPFVLPQFNGQPKGLAACKSHPQRQDHPDTVLSCPQIGRQPSVRQTFRPCLYLSLQRQNCRPQFFLTDLIKRHQNFPPVYTQPPPLLQSAYPTLTGTSRQGINLQAFCDIRRYVVACGGIQRGPLRLIATAWRLCMWKNTARLCPCAGTAYKKLRYTGSRFSVPLGQPSRLNLKII